MKILYLTTWDFANEVSDGVCKKIKSQLTVFETKGYHVDFIWISGNEIYYREDGVEKSIGRVGTIKKTLAYMKIYRWIKDKRYDYVYNRYGMMDTFYFKVLKSLKRNGAQILLEIPTYPYVGEKPDGFLFWLMFKWDAAYIDELKKVVNRIITYSKDTIIFGIPTIQIRNGIEIDAVKPVCAEGPVDDIIDMLAVALMQPHHGYERLLYGLREYYMNGGKRSIKCHFVGEGPEKKKYEKIVNECGLKKRVTFYGMKGGKELDDIYNLADIGICSLGCYKKGIYWSSELKAREYLAKGLPIVSGIEIDIYQDIEEDYFLQFPCDSTWLDIDKIINFYDAIYTSGQRSVARNIREMAEKYIDMDAMMKPVCDYMEMGMQEG